LSDCLKELMMKAYVLAGRLAVAGVWAYEGLVCKILGGAADQREIVSGVLPRRAVRPALAALGCAELALAGWVLSGKRPKLAAAVQTGVVAALNTGGLLFGSQAIPDPGRLLTQNAALVALAWAVTDG
jgi:hypothetical protein